MKIGEGVRVEWWSRVEAILDEKSLLKHPFYQAWTQGKLSRVDLACYAQQYYQQESRFPRYVSAVHSNCPELKVRQMLLENLGHEESGPENHPELWLRFAEAVGSPRPETVSAAAEPESRKCVETFRTLTRDSDWAEGLGALYAYESQQPDVARAKIEGLKKFYGVDSPRALEFFEVHAEMDAWHSRDEREALLETAIGRPHVREKVCEAVSRACDALNGLLNGVCRTRGIGAPCAAA